jgi:hypothetical protein
MTYILLSDAVLIAHLAFVAFVVFGGFLVCGAGASHGFTCRRSHGESRWNSQAGSVR